MEILEGMKQSENDKRIYRLITLENKIDILLIEDAEAQRSACACNVGIGSFANPPEAEGLAHFLEHMLFMGTETYPDENDYSAFLNAHSGGSNAYTTEENTVYYFTVANDSLKPAMDRFSAFFWCPLFTEDSTDREITAVDNENTKNLQTDAWRNMQLMKSMARADHPFNSFSTGNAETLRTIPEKEGVNMRELLLSFHKEYYSANVMKVVVYGKDNIDILQTWAQDMWSKVPNTDVPLYRVPSDPFTKQEAGHFVKLVPVKDIKTIDIHILLPEQHSNYRSRPGPYLSHLVGHESAGSLLAALKEAGLANGLSSSCYNTYRDFSFFVVTIQLTDLGLSRPDDVVEVFWAYVAMLKREGVQEWIAEECAHIAHLNFSYPNKSDPADYAVKISNHMHICDKSDIICGGDLVLEIDLDTIKELLESFFIENSITVLASQSLVKDCTLTEKYYGTQHAKAAYSDNQLKTWKLALAGVSKWATSVDIPKPNPFVPSDFTLREIPPCRQTLIKKDTSRLSRPVLLQRVEIEPIYGDNLYESELQSGEEGIEKVAVKTSDTDKDKSSLEQYGRVMTTWFLQDSKWKFPRMRVNVRLEFLAYTSPLAHALNTLYSKVLEELVNEISYYADCADLYLRVNPTDDGLVISLAGYNHKLPSLLTKLLQQIKELAKPGSCDVKIYNRLKEQLMRSYVNNHKFMQPYRIAMLGIDQCLFEPSWNYPDRYNALDTSTQQDFESWAANILHRIHIKVSVAGNATPTEAIDITKLVHSELKCQPLPLAECRDSRIRAVSLEPGVQYTYRQFALHHNPAELNSAIKNVYYVCDRSAGYFDICDTTVDGPQCDLIMAHAKLLMIEQLLNEAAFDQLRTKEQLGYIASAYADSAGFSLAFSFVVQSNSRSAQYLDERIENFLQLYRIETLEQMSQEVFAENIAAVVEVQNMQPKNLREESNRMQDEIRSANCVFDRAERLSTAVKALTFEDVKAFYDMFLLPTSSHRRKFSSQFFGANAKCARVPTAPGGVQTILIDSPNAFKSSAIFKPKRYHESAVSVEVFAE